MTFCIELSKGLVAAVSEEDYKYLSQYRWYTFINKRGKTYARRLEYVYREDGKKIIKTIFMHRQILNATQGQDVDHIDGNGLNNTRDNLRLCSRQQNAQNRNKIACKPLTSIYKGVNYNKRRTSKKKWEANIYYHGKRILLGYYLFQEEAAIAYNTKAIELFGEYAKLNEVI